MFALGMTRDDLAKKIRDPSKCELVARSLLATTTPSAEELVQMICELAPFDVTHETTESEKLLVEVEKRVQAATEESKKGFDGAWEHLRKLGSEKLLKQVAVLAEKYSPGMLRQPCDEGISVEQLREIAVNRCPQMLRAMHALVEKAGGRFLIAPETMIERGKSTLSLEQCVNSVKELERAKSKVISDYGGDVHRVVDFVRATAITCSSWPAATGLYLSSSQWHDQASPGIGALMHNLCA